MRLFRQEFHKHGRPRAAAEWGNFDEKTEIDHADSDGKEISMIMERNGNIIDFTIDEKSIYLISDNNDRDETRSFQPDTTLQDVCDWMTQFLIQNTENAES